MYIVAILITNNVLSVSYQSICHVRLQPEIGEEGETRKLVVLTNILISLL